MVASPLDRPSGLVRGACPSAHRPFDALDGALVRVRCPGGTVTAPHLRAIAAAAGPAVVVEITNRANLQLRGIPADRVDDVLHIFVDAGVVRADGEADERRNVVASPTAGVDRSELVDTRPLVAAIDEMLTSSRATGVAPKFGVLVDGGGATHVRGRAVDLALGAVRGPGGAIGFEVALANGLPLDGPRAVSWVPLERALEVVGVAIDACTQFGRATAWVESRGADAAVRALAMAATTANAVAPSVRPIGVVAQRQRGHVLVGGAPALGRLDGLALHALADLADRFGTGAVRTTPWRGFVVTDVVAAAAGTLVARLEALDLSCDPAHPVHNVVACAGNTGCASGWRDVQDDARALIARLETVAPADRPATVHVSGCTKRCAHPAVAPVALVANEAGRYDVFRDDEPVALDVPTDRALDEATHR